MGVDRLVCSEALSVYFLQDLQLRTAANGYLFLYYVKHNDNVSAQRQSPEEERSPVRKSGTGW